VEELTARQQVILAMIVREYISTAKSIGSQTIVDDYGLRISSATVRNEMAYLEEAGYLTHPHTSAGRVPTEKGYRYFVERLMEEAALSLAEQRMIRHQFSQLQMDVKEWMKLAAAILARTTLTASVVSPPKAHRGRFKQLELIPVHGATVLAVLVLQGGIVLQSMLGMEQPISPDDLHQLSNRLTDVMSGLDVVGIRSRLPSMSLVQAQCAHQVIAMMEGMDAPRELEIFRDGLLNVLNQPEYVETKNFRQLVGVLESDALLETLLAEAAPNTGVQIIIGGEGRWNELSECSIVMAHYGIMGEAVGSLGLLGPLRMPYARAVSAVRYVSDVLSELVYQFYGLPWEGASPTSANQEPDKRQE
jgi:heat-inducible transcriptional repressor